VSEPAFSIGCILGRACVVITYACVREIKTARIPTFLRFYSLFHSNMDKTEKERRIAHLLNDASAYGLKNENLTLLIDEYFCANVDSGSDSEGSDSDWDDRPNTSATGLPSETLNPSNELENQARTSDNPPTPATGLPSEIKPSDELENKARPADNPPTPATGLPIETKPSDDLENQAWIADSGSEAEAEFDDEVISENYGMVDDASKIESVIIRTASEKLDMDLVDPPEISSRCGCSCQLFNGKRCIEQFSKEEIDNIQLSVMEMTPSEKDLLLLGIICSSVNNSANTMKSRKKPGQQDVRRHARIRWFYYQHFRICRATFLHIMVMSKTKLTAVKKWYLKHGLLPRKKLSGNLKIKSINKD